MDHSDEGGPPPWASRGLPATPSLTQVTNTNNALFLRENFESSRGGPCTCSFSSLLSTFLSSPSSSSSLYRSFSLPGRRFTIFLLLSLPSGLCPLSLSTAKNGAVFYTDTRTDKQAHTNNSRSNMSILLFFLLASVITFKTLWLCALRSFSLGRRRLCGGCKREDYPIRVKRCGFCSFYQLLL